VLLFKDLIAILTIFISKLILTFSIYFYLPGRTWADGIRGLLGEKGLMEDDWNDRSNWRKKIL